MVIKFEEVDNLGECPSVNCKIKRDAVTVVLTPHYMLELPEKLFKKYINIQVLAEITDSKSGTRNVKDLLRKILSHETGENLPKVVLYFYFNFFLFTNFFID